MAFIDIVFGEYAPDRGGEVWGEDPGYLVRASSVYPTESGYRPIQPATLTGSATATGTSDTRGFFVTKSGQQQFMFVSDGQSVFQTEDEGDIWNDVTQTSTMVANRVDFFQYDDLVIHTSQGSIGPQSKKVVASLVTDPFTALAGSPPTASVNRGARIRDHAFLCTTQGVRWSSIGDPEDWPTPGGASALSSQAGSQTLSDEYGNVSYISSGEKFGLVFQDSAITRFTYVGGSVVYQVDIFEKELGISAIGIPPIRVGDLFYFINEQGIYVTDGYTVKDLSKNRVSASLIHGDIGSPETKMAVSLQYASAAVDLNKGYIAFLPGAITGAIIIYSYKLDRFTIIEPTQTSKRLAYGKRDSTDYSQTIFDLATTAGGHVTRAWVGTSASTAVILQTGFMELVPGARVQIRGAYLLGANYAAPTLKYRALDDPSSVDAAESTFTSMTAANRDNVFSARENGRFFSFQVTGNQAPTALIRGIRVYYEVQSQDVAI